jgi:hypothetical protein
VKGLRCFFGCVGCAIFTTCLLSKPNADAKTVTSAKPIGRRIKGYLATSSILKILEPLDYQAMVITGKP